MQKSDSVLDTKLVRLMQIREQLAEYKEWKHPAPDEIDHILSLMKEWHEIADLKLPQDELSFRARTSGFSFLPYSILPGRKPHARSNIVKVAEQPALGRSQTTRSR